jgi:1-deoxy-D-xylulose-5-phosphate synthase
MFSNWLTNIETPADLRQLSVEDLPQVCEALRQFIIDHVSRYGGHFGASLGTVELTVALHYVLNTPDDVLVWDVGHQAYGHKILTGRQAKFTTNRTLGGLSGFPKRAESEYDAFGTGHSSTSISAALGMAQAARLLGRPDRLHVAVIGDGAMTAGLAFEALNNAGSPEFREANLLVVLNDNGMSIDQNVGALPRHLGSLPTLSAGQLNQPNFHADNFFGQLGLAYTGVADGHDVRALVRLLAEQKKLAGPRVLHVRTVKGKGYPAAENEQVTWHSPGKFDKLTGAIRQKSDDAPQVPKYQDVFGQTLVELAGQNPRLVAITPAMLSGSSLNQMKATYPDRTFDVGIAEQHAVTFAAGLAAAGLLPYCAIYSTFAQRAYDQLVHDVAVQGLRLVLCLDRAGLVGADGATHHGAFDVAYLRCLPNTILAAPLDEVELRHLLFTAQTDVPELAGKLFCIRYPRGQGVRPDWRQFPPGPVAIGTGRQVRKGSKIAILAYGHVGNLALEACQVLAEEGLQPSVYDMRFAKPLDTSLLTSIFSKYYAAITIEDGCVTGGFGSAVVEWAAGAGVHAKTIVRLGIPDEFIDQGEPAELFAQCGFDAAGIAQAARRLYYQFGSLGEQ